MTISMGDRDDKRDRRATSQTLERGLMVIELAAASPGMTVGEISSRLSLSRTAVVRLLRTLRERGYVAGTPDGTFVLGPRMIELSDYGGTVTAALIRSVLAGLADETGATAHLTAAIGDRAVAMLVQEPRTSTYHVSYRAGMQRPLSQGASGIAILSARPAAVDDPEPVVVARERGWATSQGQLEEGTWGLAVAVPGLSTELSVGLVYLREPDDLDLSVRVLARAAREIASALGPRADSPLTPKAES